MPFDLTASCAAIQPSDEAARLEATDRHAGLAKPPGSLGALEALGERLSAIAGRCPPPVPHQPSLIVAAGDHGVHADGVSPWPQAITAIMAGVIADGRAASSVLAAGAGCDVTVLDVGCAVPPMRHPNLREVNVVRGTRNLRTEDAMSADEAMAALAAGHRAGVDAIDAGADVLLLGDMGIANTTASSCLIACLADVDAATATGRGTGIDDETLERKTAIVREAMTRVSDRRDALEVLAAVGGAEHAALAGVILAGAERRIPILLDGVITNAAALVAVGLAPLASNYLIAGHRSVEPGATIALGHLGLTPVLDLDLRLGEGTGALLALPVVQGAARVLSQMASLADLGF